MNETTIVATEDRSGPKASTHKARCVFCGRVTWIKFLEGEAKIRESCRHFQAVAQAGGMVNVLFGPAAQKSVLLNGKTE